MTGKPKLHKSISLAIAVLSIGYIAVESAMLPAFAKVVYSDTNVFEDKKLHYKLRLPAGWKTKTDMIVNLVAAPAESYVNPNPIPNIKIVVRDLPEGQTRDTICDTAMRQWGSIWKIESDQKIDGEYTPTRQLVMTQTLQLTSGDKPVKQETKILKAFAANKSHYFIISCSDYGANFPESLPEFRKVIGSLIIGE